MPKKAPSLLRASTAMASHGSLPVAAADDTPKQDKVAYSVLGAREAFSLSNSRLYELVKDGVLEMRHDGRKS